MKLNLQALTAATRAHLSPAVAAVLPSAAAALYGFSEPPVLVKDADVGELILRALLPNPLPERVAMAEVKILLPGELVLLNAEDALGAVDTHLSHRMIAAMVMTAR